MSLARINRWYVHPTGAFDRPLSAIGRAGCRRIVPVNGPEGRRLFEQFLRKVNKLQAQQQLEAQGTAVIKREVTVFSNVRHGPGTSPTGWTYRDGSGGVPYLQYCYYIRLKLQ